ncbi:MAG: response regulator transcription factor [Ferruginibacter sp.]
MEKRRILYAEDDETLAYLTVDNLVQHNYEVAHFSDGEQCLQAFKSSSFDLCVLDVMLPKLDGFSLAGQIRSLDHEIPIIFLSAKILKEDRIKGLRIGADDYMVKPFSIEELVLKIEIFINRSKKKSPGTKAICKVGNFVFDAANFTIENDKGKVMLTQREAELLKYFLDNKNKVLKREEILHAIWGKDDYFLGRSLDVFVSRLRKIFSSDDKIKIENLHSIGFKFAEKE